MQYSIIILLSGLNPNSVYAWQSKESPYVLPAIRGESESLSMAGFLKKITLFKDIPLMSV